MENRPILNAEETGKQIVNLREKCGLSVRMLADRLGYENPQLVYDWQKGRRIPSADNLVALAHIFQVKVDDILIVELIGSEEKRNGFE